MRNRWAMRPGTAGLVALGALFFLVLSYLPLAAGELWGHLDRGHRLLAQGWAAIGEPTLPLAEGMRVADGAWLSAAALAAVDRRGGEAWVSIVFALTTLAVFLVLGRTYFLQTGRRVWAVVGCLIALALGWGGWSTFRPETLGALGFALLLWLAVSGGPEEGAAGTPRSRRLWWGVPLLFLLWVNLHESYLLGLAFLVCQLLGKAVDVGWRERRAGAVLDDRGVRRRLWLLELAVAASLVNPRGIGALLDGLGLWPGPAGEGLAAAGSVAILGPGGRELALSWLALLIVLRRSSRRVPAAHVLLLAFFGVAAALEPRHLLAYAPVFALVLIPHLASLLPRGERPGAGPELAEPRRFGLPAGPSWHWTLLAALFLWVAFALSPFGARLMGRAGRERAQIVGRATPLALAAHLRESPPAGQIFNPLGWGDWLRRDGPPDLQLFAGHPFEQLPRRVRQDYGRIARAGRGWEPTLERYAVTTVVVDRARQRELSAALAAADAWRLVYEDDRAQVFTRGAPPAAPAEEDASVAPPPALAYPAP